MLSALLNFSNENIKTKQNCLSSSNTAASRFLIHVLNEPSEPLGSLDLKPHCTDRSVCDIKRTAREIQKHEELSNRSRGALMSHTDRSDGDDPLQAEQD